MKSTYEPPARIASRPDPDDWGEDELLTLPEAAALLWPSGPLTTRSLRTAERRGQLAAVMIAGKLFTTRRSLARMSECRNRADGAGSAEEAPDDAGRPTFDELVAAKIAHKLTPSK